MKKQGFDKTQVGQRIDNIPDTGTLTGNWSTDYYGCWWEYKLDQPSSVDGQGPVAWLIGEYPKDLENLTI